MGRLLLVLPLVLSAGCYLFHEKGGDGPRDAADRDGGRRDAGRRDGGPDADDEDAAVEEDAGPDAGRDSGGRDAAYDAGDPDAGPPPPPTPPDPTTCRIDPVIHPFDDPVLETRWPSGPVMHAASIHVSSTPVVIDLDGEEPIEPVVIFVSYPPLSVGPDEPPGILRIWDPRADTTISYPPIEGELGVLEPTGHVAAGDLDGDGENEIVGQGRFSGTYAFETDGSLMWESAYPTATDRGDRYGRIISGAPAIADLDGDGEIEVIDGRTVLDGATGELEWRGEGITGIGNNQFFGHISCVADLDGDGMMEVIAGNTAFHHDGEIYWNNAAVPDGFCAVAEMDGSHRGPEVVLVSNGYVRLLDGRTGEQFWLQQLEGRVRLSLGGAPNVADFDGDGTPEIGTAHGAAYGVYDPDCRGAGMPAACLGPGVLWMQSSSDVSSSGTGSSVFDFNGDGRAEVIYNDEQYFRIYDGPTGMPLFEHRNSSRTRTENPVIADVDNDGDAEIVFTANAEAFFIRDWWTDPGVEIWGDARGRWVGARRIWNQHSYHITNVEEDGSIPTDEVDSWTVLNAYRQNLREGADVLVVPDLWGGHGSFECVGSGRAVLRVQVQNWGLERVGPGVVVGFYRGPIGLGDRVGEARTTRTLEGHGDSETVELEVELTGPVIDYFALLDDPEDPPGGAIAECREENNEVLIWRPRCP